MIKKLKTMIKNFSNKVEKVDGLIEIVDNQFIISNPVNGGLEPKLIIPKHDNISILLNGVKVVGEKSLQENDEVKVESQEIKPFEYSLSYTVSDDKLYALVKKDIIKGEQYTVKDAKKSNTIEVSFVKEKFENPIPESEIINSFSEEDFQGDIIEENVKTLSLSEEVNEIAILKGIEPFYGEQAYYERKVEETEFNFFPKGVLLGTLKEAKPAKNGIDIFGEEIVVDFKTKELELGDGIKKEGNNIYSDKDGRLIFSEDKIKIVPQLVIPRDLTPEDGLVMFDEGDVLIQGSACEGSFIRASGVVMIEGGAYHTNIISEDGVSVKESVSHCNIYSGFSMLYFEEIIRNLESFSSLLKEFLIKLELYEDSKHDKLEKKDDVHKIAKEFEAKLEKGHDLFDLVEKHGNKDVFLSHKKYNELVKLFSANISIEKRFSLTDIEISNFLSKIEQFIVFLKPFISEEKKLLKAGSIDSSNCFSFGSIEVTGLGVYLSKLESGDNIVVDGGVKGGNLLAKNSVELRTFKSLEAHQGIIVRNPHGHIKMDKRSPYTILQIDDFIDENEITQTNVYLTKI